MVGIWSGINVAALLASGLVGVPDWADLKKLIDNETSELAIGGEYLCTEVDFKEMASGLVLIHTENYYVRDSQRIAMKETRHVPLKKVSKIAVLEDEGHPGQERRFLVLVQYKTESTRVYLQQTGEDEAFANQQAFTMGTFTEKRAERILADLKRLCIESGADLK